MEEKPKKNPARPAAPKKRVRFKPHTASRVHGDGGTTPSEVYVDGVLVGYVRKRSEWYGNLGRKGVRYHYFDFFRVADDGSVIYEETTHEMRDGSTRTERKPLATNGTRKQAVAEALVRLGHPDAGREVDANTAEFAEEKIAREQR